MITWLAEISGVMLHGEASSSSAARLSKAGNRPSNSRAKPCIRGSALTELAFPVASSWQIRSSHDQAAGQALAPATIETACAATSVMMTATLGSAAYLRISAGELTVHSRQGSPAAAALRSTPSVASW